MKPQQLANGDAYLSYVVLRDRGIDFVPYNSGHYFTSVKKQSAVDDRRLFLHTHNRLLQVSKTLDERSSSLILMVFKRNLSVK